MSIPADWIEHRRGDGEQLGWMRPLTAPLIEHVLDFPMPATLRPAVG